MATRIHVALDKIVTYLLLGAEFSDTNIHGWRVSSDERIIETL